MRDIVLYGSGGFAREVLQILLDVNDEQPTWTVLGFLDDDPGALGQDIHGYPVLGGSDWLLGRPEVQVSVAIGSPHIKRRIVNRLAEQGHTAYATLVHPRAWIGRRVQLGSGVTICAGTCVTTDIQIGDHVILNLDCTVGHDSILGDFVTAAPSVNVSGNVEVGEGCDLGTGSVVIQGKSIGEWSIVGAGAVVVKDLPANVTAVGAPASPIKTRPDGWHLQ